jgi:hypothetical protein
MIFCVVILGSKIWYVYLCYTLGYLRIFRKLTLVHLYWFWLCGSMLPHNQNCQKRVFKIINLQMY